MVSEQRAANRPFENNILLPGQQPGIWRKRREKEQVGQPEVVTAEREARLARQQDKQASANSSVTTPASPTAGGNGSGVLQAGQRPFPQANPTTQPTVGKCKKTCNSARARFGEWLHSNQRSQFLPATTKLNELHQQRHAASGWWPVIFCIAYNLLGVDLGGRPLIQPKVTFNHGFSGIGIMGFPNKPGMPQCDQSSEMPADTPSNASLLAAIVNSSCDAIISKTFDGVITTWNPGATNLFGYSAAEMIGQSIRRLIPQDRQDEETRFLHQLSSGTAIEQYETVRLHKSGEPIDVSATISPIRDVRGRIIGASTVARDIRPRKRTENLLRKREAQLKSEERLRLAQEAALAGSWEWALHDGLNIWSNSLWDLYGLTPGQCEPSFESWASSIHPDDRGQAAATVTAAAAAGREFEIQWRVNLSDGDPVRWLLSRGRPVAGAHGAPERYIGIVMDITARKQAEAELERMRIILAEGERIAHLGSFEYIAATEETVWSDEEKRIYGLDPAGPSPVYEEMLRHHIHPDDAAELDRDFRKAFQNGAVFENENRIVRPDGSIRWIYNCAHPYFDSAGKLAKYIGATLDITERKHREEQIRLLLREVNHRSKNMLALVQAIARQTIAADPEDFIERFGERIQALAAAQDLLVKSEWQGVDFGELVRSQLAHFKDLMGTRIELKGPPFFIRASAAQTFGMALHELATNAGKYGALSSSDGRVAVEWTLHRAETGTEMFAITWRESGGPPVVAPERQGFGSTVIGSLAEMHLGANVDIDFAATGFKWRLECSSRELEDGERPAHGSVRTKPLPSRMQTGTQPRILIVEDERLVAFEIALILSDAGFDVLGPARCVVSALDLIERSGCDAAVLDINLGNETSEPLALELRRRGTPFVTLSGYSREQQPRGFETAPALSKPLQPDILVVTIRNCLEKQAAGRAH
jgi:PAS domain S-box-containing protein